MEIPPFACQNICFLQVAAPNPPTLPDTPAGQCPADPAQHGSGWAVLPPPCSPPGSPKSHISSGANKPTKPRAHSSSSPPCPWHCPTMVPSLHLTVPRSGNLPPKARAKGWVTAWRAADHSRGPHRSALALGCARKSSLLSKTLCRESCTAVLSVTRSPSENGQLLPIKVIWRQKFSSK